MKDRAFMILAGAAVVLAGSIGVYAFKTDAAQPPKVYGLYDANHTYLGDIVGIDALNGPISGQFSSYTTYLPSVHGILRFINTGNVTAAFANVPDYIEYDQPDCQGNASIRIERGFTSPFILKFRGATYSIGTTLIDPPIVSIYDVQADSCSETSSPEVPISYALTPVTLPFNLNEVQLPFSMQ